MTRFRHAGALLCAALLLLSAPAAALAQPLTRAELRALAPQSHALPPDDPFAEQPALTAPYAPGRLTPALAEAALDRLNFLRALAGLDPVRADDSLDALAQHAAALLAAQRLVSHAPPRPDDMDDAFFSQAAEGAANCSLASFNWFEPALAADSMDWFALDDTPANLGDLAHRRWLLCPAMGRTGFGLALDAEGRSYVALYVTDASAPSDYDLIRWPAPGAFPAELMRRETPWSISPNPAKYDLQASRPRVLLEELVSGARWDSALAGSDPAQGGYFLVSEHGYGGGPAIIFRPDLMEFPALEDGYEQNQAWRVTLEGLAGPDGTALPPVVYTVEMASLTPIDPASVELTSRSLTLRAGETADVDAVVYPRWADDLSCTLSTSDESVAIVDENGRLSALAPGKCLLRAETVNGRFDEIDVTVDDGEG